MEYNQFSPCPLTGGQLDDGESISRTLSPASSEAGYRVWHFALEPMTNHQSAEDKRELISLAEASNRYGFSRTYLRQIAQKGRLKAQKIGGVWLTTPAAVEEYIQSRAKRGAYREDVGLDNTS